MSTLEHELRVAVNVSVDGHQEMAGFEVSINGRFWVSTEVTCRPEIVSPFVAVSASLRLEARGGRFGGSIPISLRLSVTANAGARCLSCQI